MPARELLKKHQSERERVCEREIEEERECKKERGRVRKREREMKIEQRAVFDVVVDDAAVECTLPGVFCRTSARCRKDDQLVSVSNRRLEGREPVRKIEQQQVAADRGFSPNRVASERDFNASILSDLRKKLLLNFTFNNNNI